MIAFTIQKRDIKRFPEDIQPKFKAIPKGRHRTPDRELHGAAYPDMNALRKDLATIGCEMRGRMVYHNLQRIGKFSDKFGMDD